jgi:HYR domain
VVNDDGGTLTAADFSFVISATNPSPGSFAGVGPPGQIVTLDPGPYLVTTYFPAGIPLISSESPDCSGTIAAGESKTCTVTFDDLPPDTAPPTVTCGAADGLWHGANVSISCTAYDRGSGLANPADAAFSLNTTVPDYTEDANASTESRQICDVAGNCASAGPIGGNKIDRERPTLSLPGSVLVDATSPAGATVGWIVSARDGADPNPSVTCIPRAGSIFPIGSMYVTCTATDHVGNTAGPGHILVTVLGAKEQLSNLIQKVINYSSLPQTAKTQLIGAMQSLLAGFDPANATQKQLACNALMVFIRAVQSNRTLPASVAAGWIADATRIRAVLGC